MSLIHVSLHPCILNLWPKSELHCKLQAKLQRVAAPLDSKTFTFRNIFIFHVPRRDQCPSLTHAQISPWKQEGGDKTAWSHL